MAFDGICPYLQDWEGRYRVKCECASFHFPDKAARRELIYGFCGHPTAYNDCVFKKIMDKYYYERKFADEDQK